MSGPTPFAVVGNLNLDLKAGPLPPDPRLFRDGETSVPAIIETLGGGGANTAVAAARLGGQVTLCAAVGADELGDRLAAFLARCGVTPALARTAAPTGRSLALSWTGHQRHFLSCLPSAALLTADLVDVAALAASGCRQLYRADVWFAPLMLAEGNQRLLGDARQHGMATSLDVNWDPHWHAGRQDAEVCRRIAAVAELLPNVDYVHGNQRELCFCAGAETLERAAEWFFAHGAGHLVLHLGPEGSALWSADGQRHHAPAVPVAEVVGETGSGDVFTAAFLLHGDLARANAAAAEHLSGETDYLPTMD